MHGVFSDSDNRMDVINGIIESAAIAALRQEILGLWSVIEVKEARIRVLQSELYDLKKVQAAKPASP